MIYGYMMYADLCHHQNCKGFELVPKGWSRRLGQCLTWSCYDVSPVCSENVDSWTLHSIIHQYLAWFFSSWIVLWFSP